MAAIPKKLPKRCGRGPGAWIALANGRNNKNRELVHRAPHTGINYPHLGDAGSAAYRRSLKK